MTASPLSHYVAYMRPKTFPATFVMAVTGYALSPVRPDAASRVLWDLSLLFLVHSVLLWGGVNAFNSSQDRDQGPLNLLPDPPPQPSYLLRFSLFLQGAALVIAAFRGWWPLVLVAAAIVLSTYYSIRLPGLRRGKEIPVVDILINALGCGIGSIALGYSFAGGSPLDSHAIVSGLGFSAAIFGGLPTSQIFQLSSQKGEPRERNYAALLGVRGVLLVGPLFFAVHIVVLAFFARPGWKEVFLDPIPATLWIGWLLLVAVGGIHSLCWSRSPFHDAYLRMVRQFGVMMASQALWTAAAWLT